MTIRRMRIARYIPKATNTHSQYVILIDFPLQQRSHERVSMLRYSTLPVCYNCITNKNLTTFVDYLFTSVTTIQTNISFQLDRLSRFTRGTRGRRNWPSGSQHEKKQNDFRRQNVTNTSSAFLLKKKQKVQRQ